MNISKYNKKLLSGVDIISVYNGALYIFDNNGIRYYFNLDDLDLGLAAPYETYIIKVRDFIILEILFQELFKFRYIVDIPYDENLKISLLKFENKEGKIIDLDGYHIEYDKNTGFFIAGKTGIPSIYYGFINRNKSIIKELEAHQHIVCHFPLFGTKNIDDILFEYYTGDVNMRTFCWQNKTFKHYGNVLWQPPYLIFPYMIYDMKNSKIIKTDIGTKISNYNIINSEILNSYVIEGGKDVIKQYYIIFENNMPIKYDLVHTYNSTGDVKAFNNKSIIIKENTNFYVDEGNIENKIILPYLLENQDIEIFHNRYYRELDNLLSNIEYININLQKIIRAYLN